MMSHGTSTRMGPAGPWTRMRRALFSALLLFAGCLTAVTVRTLAIAPQARADTVPPAPAGWTTVFGDNFAGAAGSAPSSANWFYDIGTGYGTGEIRADDQLDQQRLPGRQRSPGAEGNANGGTWTSARIESARDDFQAPAGRQAGDDRVDRAAEPGQRSRLLAGVLGTWLAHAGRRWLAAAPARST